MDNINFSQLKYNLYELLDLQNTASDKEIRKRYKQIIKNFHPDKNKISNLESELYYDIVQAHHILTNDSLRYKYDNYLYLHKNNTSLRGSGYEYKNISHLYVPDNKQDAQKQHNKQIKDLYARHGGQEVKEKLSTVYKRTVKEREHMPEIQREDFKDTDDFNNQFIQRKKGGIYSDKVVKYKGGAITAYEGNTSLGLTSLKDFNNMYSEDTVANGKFASRSIAFNLMPHVDVEEEDFDYGEVSTNYEDVSHEIRNNIDNQAKNNVDWLNNF